MKETSRLSKRLFFHEIGLLLICLFIFTISNSVTGNSALNSDNEILNEISFIKSTRDLTFQIDSAKLKKNNSLDGNQTIFNPEFEVKLFDRDSPFNKLTFKMLSTYIPGKPVPEELKKLNEKNVEILGFMTPLNAMENMNVFLLCSEPPLNCYCAPPVSTNEMIYVKLIDSKTDFMTGAVRVKGQLNIKSEISNEYSDIIYTISASEVK